MIAAILGHTLLHNPVEVSLGNQILHPHLDSLNAILLGNDADIGSTHVILLSGFSGSVVTVIIHQIGTSKRIQLLLCVIGLAILPFGRNMVAIGVGAN